MRRLSPGVRSSKKLTLPTDGGLRPFRVVAFRIRSGFGRDGQELRRDEVRRRQPRASRFCSHDIARKPQTSKIGRDDWIRTSDPLTPSQIQRLFRRVQRVSGVAKSVVGLRLFTNRRFTRVQAHSGSFINLLSRCYPEKLERRPGADTCRPNFPPDSLNPRRKQRVLIKILDNLTTGRRPSRRSLSVRLGQSAGAPTNSSRPLCLLR
jgi:hypothetical protein